jgi:RNase P/RNase MRP subunit p30
VSFSPRVILRLALLLFTIIIISRQQQQQQQPLLRRRRDSDAAASANSGSSRTIRAASPGARVDRVLYAARSAFAADHAQLRSLHCDCKGGSGTAVW